MSILTLTNAQLAYGHHALLDHAEFSLETNERVGLVGRNGTGKSSLLKVIARQVALDDGLCTMQQGLKIAYVPQEPEFESGLTVAQVVLQGLHELQTMHLRYQTLTQALGDTVSHAESDNELAQLHALHAAIDAHDGWNLEQRVNTVIARFTLPENALIETLSGGMKKRVALARAMVAQPDLLLLDEPTNHLDFTSIEWLEEWLCACRATLLFITHDRRFLDRVATRIIELDRGKLTSYPGNFSAYQIRKAQQLEVEAVHNAKFDKFLAQEEVWIRKGIEARRTRNEGRVRRLEALRQTHVSRRDQQGQVRLAIDQGERSGKIIAEMLEVSKQYSDRSLIRDLNLLVMRGDKVGLIGANGAGKTTLLKLLLGEIKPDAGAIKTGTQLQVAYFDQMREQLDEEAALIEMIAPGSEWIEINGARKHVMSYLGDFLFAPERARSPVKSLSGGERNRLLLARLFARPANVLVLDEPTNDLDIETLELLEELLQNYAGTVFLVSHDRAFLDNVVTQVVVAQGQGRWEEYIGGYSDWQRQSARQNAGQIMSQSAPRAGSGAKSVDSALKASVKAVTVKKLSYKEQRELESLPLMITQLESELAALTEQLADTALYLPQNQHQTQNQTQNQAQNQAQGQKVGALKQRYTEIERQLAQYFARWDALEKK